jgi:hypothetical protein
MNWKRTRGKEPLFEIFSDLKPHTTFVYKEVDDKVQIKYTYMQTIINKSDMNKYLDPVVTDGKIEEVTPELSVYLDDAFKKAQKKG